MPEWHLDAIPDLESGQMNPVEPRHVTGWRKTVNYQAFVSFNGAQLNTSILLESSGISFPDYPGTHYSTAFMNDGQGLPFAISYPVSALHSLKIGVHGYVYVFQIGRPGA